MKIKGDNFFEGEDTLKKIAGILNKRQTYVFLAVISLITGFVLYYRFIFGDRILVYADWGSDTWQLYLPSYEFWHNKIMQGRFFAYDFSYGWGKNSLAILWAIADPFSAIPVLLSCVFGVNFIGKTLVYFQILKSVVISLLGMKYFKMLGYSDRSAFIPSYILGFCGYMIVTGEHYFFSTFAVLFMVVLIYTEKTLQEKKFQYGLCFAIAETSIFSSYAMFQTAVAIGIYVLLRNVLLSGSIREYVSNIFFVLKGAVVGMLLSCVSFLVQAYEIFVISIRVSEGGILERAMASLKLLPEYLLKETLFNLFSNNLMGTVNNYEGYGGARFQTTPYFFSALLSFALVYYLYKTIRKTNRNRNTVVRYISLIIGLAILVNSFYAMFMNLFAYLQWRFVFTIIPFSALVIVDFLEDVFSGKRFCKWILCVPPIIAVWIAGNCNRDNGFIRLSAANMLIATLFSTLAFIVFDKKKNVVFLSRCLLGIVGINLLIDDGVVIYGDQIIMSESELENQFHDQRMDEILNDLAENEKDNFYRIDRTYIDGESPSFLFSLVHPSRTISVYDSIINGNLMNAAKEFSDDNSIYTQFGYSIHLGTKFDPVLADIYGLKYIISNLPRAVPGWELYMENNGLYVYKNMNLNGAGLLYQKRISESAYDDLDEIQKTFVFDKYIVSEKGDGIKENEVTYTEVSDGIMNVEELDDADIICLNMPADDSRRKNLCLSFSIQSMSGETVKVSFLNQNEECVEQRTYSLEEDGKQLCCKVLSDIKLIKIEYNKENTEAFLYKLYEGGESAYCNDGIFLENAKMGNVVQGTVKSENDAYLLLPIPYEDSWNIMLNGECAEYEKADFGFIMLKVKKGVNTVRLEYKNPVNAWGLWISMSALLGIVLHYILRKRK